jgi:hypothetical protein
VRGFLSDGRISDWSSSVSATTQPQPLFQPTFQETLTSDDDGRQGYTLVQRIEPTRLTTSGTQVIITLQASSTSDVSIDRIYILQPAPPAQGVKPYDSAGFDLTAVSVAPLTVPANTVRTLPPVSYNLDHTQPLLIAFDFPTAPPSGLRYAQLVSAAQAAAYFFQYGQQQPEAGLPTRSANYTVLDRIYLIQKIEVG